MKNIKNVGRLQNEEDKSIFYNNVKNLCGSYFVGGETKFPEGVNRLKGVEVLMQLLVDIGRGMDLNVPSYFVSELEALYDDGEEYPTFLNEEGEEVDFKEFEGGGLLIRI